MKDTITKEELISAFADLREFIDKYRDDPGKYSYLHYSDANIDGMFIAMGYVAGYLFKEDSVDVLHEVNKRIR